MRLNAIEAGEGPPLVLLHGLFGAAGNCGAIQRRLAARRRVIALDLRNHGASPRDAAMDYPAMAADVAETLAGARPPRRRSARPFHGRQSGDGAGPGAAGLVDRLVVADIAPVTYPPALRGYVAAMQALPLTPGLTRREADAALADAMPEPGIRAFLLQNLRSGPRRLAPRPRGDRRGDAGDRGLPRFDARYGPGAGHGRRALRLHPPGASRGASARCSRRRVRHRAGCRPRVHAENPQASSACWSLPRRLNRRAIDGKARKVGKEGKRFLPVGRMRPTPPFFCGSVCAARQVLTPRNRGGVRGGYPLPGLVLSY